MESIKAAWDMKLRTQTPLEDEALVEKGLAWARSLVEESAPYRVNDSFNVFATAAIAKCCESGGGRPDLIQLCKIPELIAWILSFPQSSKWLHVRKVLQEVHQQQPLRMPALGDDPHWLTQQAKGLCSLRTNATFAKKYPCRVQYRCNMLSPGDQATLALVLQKMDHIPISEAYAILKPWPEGDEPAKAAAAAAATTPPLTPQPLAPAEHAPTPRRLDDLFSPSPASAPAKALEDLAAQPALEDVAAPPCPVDSMGIPLMFASPPAALPLPATLKGEMLGHANKRQAVEIARPIHKGAASKHFAKEKPKAPAPAKATPVKAKKDKKLKSAQKSKKPAPAPKPPADDGSIVKVKITRPKTPPRTYVQAWRQEKWRHVITVAAHEHAKHEEIVKHVAAALRSGRLTFDEARQQKYNLLTTWE